MIPTLLLAAALTGQAPGYNLLAQAPAGYNLIAAQERERPPTARIGPEPAEMDLAPGLVRDLDEARAAARETAVALAESRAEIRRLTQRVAQLEVPAKAAPPRMPAKATPQAAAPSYQSTAPLIYESPPPVYRAAAEPTTYASSCYSGSYSSAPSSYAAAPARSYASVISAAPPSFFSSESAAPSFVSSMPIVSSGGGGLFGRNRFRQTTRAGGLFGGFRQSTRASGFSEMPAFSGSFFSGAGGVCLSGSCP